MSRRILAGSVAISRSGSPQSCPGCRMTRLRSDVESLTDERPIPLGPLHKMGKYWSESLSLTGSTSCFKHGMRSVHCATYNQNGQTMKSYMQTKIYIHDTPVRTNLPTEHYAFAFRGRNLAATQSPASMARCAVILSPRTIRRRTESCSFFLAGGSSC